MNEDFIVNTCPRTIELRSARQLLAVAVDDHFDLLVHAGEIGIDDIAVDIDHRSDVEVADGAQVLPANDGGDIPQNLDRRAAALVGRRGWC